MFWIMILVVSSIGLGFVFGVVSTTEARSRAGMLAATGAVLSTMFLVVFSTVQILG